MAQSESSVSQPTHPVEAGKKCRFLGRCDDPDIYYDYPTAANCCHTRKRPHGIEPSYQASTCLSNNWAECKRYRAATGLEVAQKPDGVSVAVLDGRRLPVWAIVGIVVAAALLIAGLYFVLNTVMANGRPTPSPAPTSVESTQVVVAGPTSSSTPTPTSTPLPSATPTATSTNTDTPVPPSDTPTPTPSHTPSPSPSHTASPTPSRTSGPTPTHTSSPTPTRTPSRTSTPTPSRTASPTPSRTPSPTPRRTRRPRPTTPNPTPTDISLPAPILLAPPDQRTFFEGDEIVLDWQSVGPLPPDLFYVPIVTYSHQGDTWTDKAPWTEDTRWILSEHRYLLDLSDDGVFHWAIQVMLQTGVDETGWPVGRPVSPRGEERTLYWLYQGGGQPTPTKEIPKTPPPSTPPPPPP